MRAFYARKGRECYFFTQAAMTGPYQPTSDPKGLFFHAFDVSNPNDFQDGELWDEHHLESRPEDRADPDLVAVVEELGAQAASGSCGKLHVIEIPDGVEYEIDDYDGLESAHEKHRSWS